MMNANNLKIGLFGIGLDAYWPQFEGLKERLENYLDRSCQKLNRSGVEIVNLGLIDSVPKAVEAGHRFRREDVDLIFLHVTTYALSSTVLPVVRRAKVPVIILNLQPVKAIDYPHFNQLGDRTKMTGEWLAHCAACPVPELSNVFQRSGIRFHEITGVLDDDPECWAEVDEWMEAAKVKYALEHNTIGLMGHYYSGMLDIYSDLTGLSATFGGNIHMLEVNEVSHLRQSFHDDEVRAQSERIHALFDVQDDCPAHEIDRAARTALALEKLAEVHGLGSVAYFSKGTGVAENEDTMSSIILGNSMLTGNGVPVAGEYEVKNVLAMKILDTLGVGGSFTEYYALDYEDDIVLMGHDGPGHIAIANGKVKVRPLEVYHGKVGKGLSVEMSIKHGPVTLLSIAEDRDGGYKLVYAHGESVPGPILEIGNTNSRYRFACGARQFVKSWNAQGTAHHCAIGLGHVGPVIEKIGRLLAIPSVEIVG